MWITTYLVVIICHCCIISVTGTESGVPGSLRVTIDHCSHRLWFGGRGSCTKKVQDGSYRYLLVQLKGAVDILR